MRPLRNARPVDVYYEKTAKIFTTATSGQVWEFAVGISLNYMLAELAIVEATNFISALSP